MAQGLRASTAPAGTPSLVLTLPSGGLQLWNSSCIDPTPSSELQKHLHS